MVRILTGVASARWSRRARARMRRDHCGSGEMVRCTMARFRSRSRAGFRVKWMSRRCISVG